MDLEAVDSKVFVITLSFMYMSFRKETNLGIQGAFLKSVANCFKQPCIVFGLSTMIAADYRFGTSANRIRFIATT